MNFDPNRVVAQLAVAAFHSGFLDLKVDEDHVTLTARVMGLRVRVISVNLKKQSQAVADERRAGFKLV